MSADPPSIFVIAGPNGAGKTTVAMHVVPKTLGIAQFVNADLIARGISPFAPPSADLDAARVLLRRIRSLIDRCDTFAFETTLASRSYVPLLREAIASGYNVHIVYIWIDSVERALSRIAARVAEGGHDVPAETVRRRYHRSLRHLFDLYMPLATTWSLYDNSGSIVVVIADGGSSRELKVFDASRYERVLASRNDRSSR